MKKIWKKISSKGYMVGMVVFMAVLGTVYFVFLKGNDESAASPMEDMHSTTEKIVFPEDTKEPWKSSGEEVLVKKETEERQAAEDQVEEPTSESEPIATVEPTPKPIPESTMEPESTPEPIAESEPTTTESTAEPAPEVTAEPSVEPDPEATPEPVATPAPEAGPSIEQEECVHHWLFDSYFQEPTCSNGGLENQICVRCGETRTVPGTPTSKHQFVVETQGDCISAEVVRCEECNSREVREKTPSNHIDVEDGVCYGCGAKTE